MDTVGRLHQVMAGNSKRRGAIRKAGTKKGPTVGSGVLSSSFITSGLPNSRTTIAFIDISPAAAPTIERRDRGARSESFANAARPFRGRFKIIVAQPFRAARAAVWQA